METNQNESKLANDWLAQSVQLLEKQSGLQVIQCPRCNNPKIAQNICQHCSTELGVYDTDIDTLAGDYAGTLTGGTKWR
jgi:hypothetical protein